VEIHLPGMGYQFGSAFCKVGRHHGLGLTVISVAASLKLEAGMIVQARVAMGVAAPTPRRVPEAESFILGEKPDPALFHEAGRLVSQAPLPGPAPSEARRVQARGAVGDDRACARSGRGPALSPTPREAEMRISVTVNGAFKSSKFSRRGPCWRSCGKTWG